jgi:hypothetical protein
VAGIDNPTISPAGFDALETAVMMGVPVRPDIATAYAENVRENVDLLQTNRPAAWVKPSHLKDKFVRGSRAAQIAKSSEATEVLTSTLSKTNKPENRILSYRDFNAARKALTEPSASFYGVH